MADSMNLKEIYEASLPTEENIDEIFAALNGGNLLSDREAFTKITNRVFGMLAHLNVETLTAEEHYKLRPLVENKKYQKFMSILGILRITAPNACCSDAGISPSAVPYVKRFRAAFDIYEKETGVN